jgi:nucleoside-diphosphate-sugar epimerase
MSRLLVFGAGGYLGRRLVPALAKQGGFQVTAVSSQPEILSAFSEYRDLVQPLYLQLQQCPLEQAMQHDVVVNLACAGVAHKGGDAIDSLTANLMIAHKICLLAKHTRQRLLLHFGSDMEQSHLGIYLNSPQGMSLAATMAQFETPLYSLSKVMQSSLIRYYASEIHLFAHVIMTPNLYGGDDHPLSLVGAMRDAVQAGLPFCVRNPTALKRFMHLDAFSPYVIALLCDLLKRTAADEGCHRFEVSSVDFVPLTTVAAFAQHQWRRLGGDPASLLLGAGD